MASLKDMQTAALNRLAVVLAGVTGVNHVWLDEASNVAELPAAVVFDEGMPVERMGQWQEIPWDLNILVYVAGLASSDGHLVAGAARDVRGDLIDALDADITLATTVSNSLYRGPVKVVEMTFGADKYIGVECPYRLVIRTGKSYA